MASLIPLIPAVTGLLGGIFGGRKQRQSRDQALNGINDYASSRPGMYQPLIDSRIQNIGDAQTRSSDIYNQAAQGFGNIISSGGAVPNQGAIKGDIRELQDWGRNSISPEDMARMRGGGGYEEFARTGGYSPQAIAELKLNAAQVPQSFFSSLAGMNSRNQAVSGGQNPGFTAQQIALARERGRGATQAKLDADIGVNEAVNAGRRWGIGGMSDSENAVQQLLSRNRLAALSGALSGDTNLAQMGSQNALAALQGLRGLRTDVPGEVNMYDRELMNLIGGLDDSQRAALQLQLGANPDQGDFFQRFSRYAAPFAGLAQRGGGQGGSSSFRQVGDVGSQPEYVRF